MSIGFNEHKSMKSKPRGYFSGKREVVGGSVRIWEYNGRATKKTGTEWINSIILVGGFLLLLLLAIASIAFEFKMPMSGKVVFIGYATVLLIIGVTKMIKCHTKVKEEIALGLGEKERREQKSLEDNTYTGEKSYQDNGDIEVLHQTYDGINMNKNIKEYAHKPPRRAKVFLMAGFITLWLGFLVIFVLVYNVILNS